MDTERIQSALETLEDEVRSLHPDTVDPGLGARLISLFARVERVGAAGTALLVRTVNDTRSPTGSWDPEGFFSSHPSHTIDG